MKEKSKKGSQRKFPVLVVIAGAVLVSFMVSLFLGQGGIFRLRQIRNDYENMLRENYNLAVENKKTAEEIKNLRSNPGTIEAIAREDLHFVSPHDTVLIVPEEDAESMVSPQNDPADSKL